MVLFGIGVITLVFVIGIPIIIIAAVWSGSRHNAATKLKSEIKELEAELE